MNDTENYLLGVGADTGSAANLALKHSIDEIQAMSPEKLEIFGLTPVAVSAISTRRPPIPPENLRTILDSNFYMCCICQHRDRDVIVHHIEPYAKSKCHDLANLCVLCLEHHSAAHTNRELAQNLTADKIRNSKKSWEKMASEAKQKIAILRLEGPWGEPCKWEWVNYPRLKGIFESMKLVAAEGYGYEKLKAVNIVDEKGHFIGEEWHHPKAKDNDYFIEGKHQFEIATHLGKKLELIARNVQILDLTSWLSNCPGFVAGSIAPEDFVAIRAPFRYRKLYSGEMVAEALSEDWTISFSFDPWYCLSSTARLIYQDSRPTTQSLFGRVRSIDTNGDHLSLVISPIGTSPTFAPHRPHFGGYIEGTKAAGEG